MQNHSDDESPAGDAAPLTYPCPCCGYLVFQDPPGSDEICPICYWQDDLSQLRFTGMGGANRVSLLEGQRNYQAFGACEESVKPYVRRPHTTDLRDSTWRMLDPAVDEIRKPVPGQDYGADYPQQTDLLYYWRQGSLK